MPVWLLGILLLAFGRVWAGLRPLPNRFGQGTVLQWLNLPPVEALRSPRRWPDRADRRMAELRDLNSQRSAWMFTIAGLVVLAVGITMEIAALA